MHAAASIDTVPLYCTTNGRVMPLEYTVLATPTVVRSRYCFAFLADRVSELLIHPTDCTRCPGQNNLQQLIFLERIQQRWQQNCKRYRERDLPQENLHDTSERFVVCAERLTRLIWPSPALTTQKWSDRDDFIVFFSHKKCWWLHRNAGWLKLRFCYCSLEWELI